jgi:type I restriction enzyme, S subunit
MQTNWKLLPIEECMAAIIDYRGKTPQKTTSGIPLVTAKVIKGGRIETLNEFIAEENYDAWMRRGIPMPGDIVLTTEAPLGEVAQLDDRKVALAQRVITLRGKEGLLDNNFLKFLLQSAPVQKALLSRSSGTTVVGIKQKELRKVELLLPPINEQKRIAHILGTLDAKIELNRALNKTLEEMAQSIFKSWFVDYDPVKAKIAAAAEGKSRAEIERAAMAAISGKPESELENLPEPQRQSLAQTAALFPVAFADSEIGEVPKGWAVGILGDIAANVREQVDPTTLDSRIPYVGLEHIKKISFSLSKWGEAASVDSQKSKFESGDFLFGKLRPYFHKVCRVQFAGICSTDILVIRPKSTSYHGIVGCHIFESSFVAYTNMRSTGTRMPRANWKDMANYRLGIPDGKVAAAFSDIAQPIWRHSATLVDQSRCLAQLRDTLLPKLLSGELLVATGVE